MRGRDLGILLVSALALLVSFTSDGSTEVSLVNTAFFPFDVTLWANQQYPSDSEQLPLPLVADIDGDGVNEVVVLTKDARIYMLDASGVSEGVREGQVGAFAVKGEASLLPKIGVKAGRQPVALASGYLDKYSADAVRTQVIAVVTKDWTIMCFDSSLKLLWETNAQEHFPEHDAHREVAVLVTSHAMKRGDRGMVLVGGSTDADSGSADEDRIPPELSGVFGKKGAEAEPEPEGEGGGHRTHFSYFALEGASGAVRWKHNAADFLPALDDSKVLYPQHAHKLEAQAPAGATHHLEVDWRQYRSALAAWALPHRWHHREDTRLALARFGPRHRPAAAGGEAAAEGPVLGASALLAGLRSPGAGAGGAGVRPHAASEHVERPDVLVAHIARGVEVVHLYTGRTVCQLPLGPGAHADINGDGVIEHVRAVPDPAATDAPDRPCLALALAGVPPREPLWNGTVCGLRAAFDLTAGRRRRAGDEADGSVEALDPLLLRRGGEARAFDSLFLISTGRLTSFGPDGELNWIAATPAYWQPRGSRALGQPPRPALRRVPLDGGAAGEAVLAVGQAHAALLAAGDGRLLASLPLPELPVAGPVVGDIDGDGQADLLLLGRSGLHALALRRSPGTRFLALLVLLFALAVAAAAAYRQVPPAPPRSAPTPGGARRAPIPATRLPVAYHRSTDD